MHANTCSTTLANPGDYPANEMSGERRVECSYSSAQKGELALLRVLQQAVEKGWLASRPTRDCRYDLVLDDGEQLYRVQVKYAGRRPWNCAGAVSLDFTKGGKRDRTYLNHEIDALSPFVGAADVIVCLGREHLHGRRNNQLRYAPTRSGQRNGCLVVSELVWEAGDEAPGSGLRIPTTTVTRDAPFANGCSTILGVGAVALFSGSAMTRAGRWTLTQRLAVSPGD